MSTATPSSAEPFRPRRSAAVATAAVLVAAGLVALPGPAAPAAAAETPETFLVSQTQGAASTSPSLTPDGQRVAFASTATDLVAGDGNGVADVFLATAVQGAPDPFAGEPVLVSTPDASLPAQPANGASSDPVVSADGRYVAFLSAATNLTADAHAPDAWTHVFMRDTLLGTTVRIQAGDAEPAGDATSVDVSDDGRYVAFVSEAANLTPDDGNSAPDAFVADLDADADGVRGDIAITRVVPARSIDQGVDEVVISGNGGHLAFTTAVALDSDDPAGSATYLYRGTRGAAAADHSLIAAGGHDPAINGNGEVVAYIATAACAGNDTVIASTIDLGFTYYVALATNLVEFRSGGTVAAPTVSADGGVVAWQTTRPKFSFSGIAPVLPAPVVRTAIPDWAAAATGGRCSHNAAGDFVDLGTGTSPGLSASGRTVAFSGPSTLAPGADAAVVATDTHSHSGLSVTSTLGELIDTGYMTVVDIAQIPVSGLEGYAAAIADAPIYRLPIYRLPIYRLPIYRLPIYRLLIEDSPIYRLPIYRLPIYRLDIPGGWPELLADTPYAGELTQSVTLAEVLEWAAQAAPDDSAATEAERAAARRIQSLTLSDVDLGDTGIDSLSLASIVLGGARLTDIPLTGGTGLAPWHDVLEAQGLETVLDDETLLADLDLAGLDVARSGIEGVALNDLPTADTLFDEIPMERLFLAGTALGALDVASLTPESRDALFETDVADGALADHVGDLRAGATVADLAAGVPDGVTFGTLLFSILDAASYPWEQIAPTSIDPNASTRDTPGYGCDGSKRCGTNAQFTFTFDPGPGETTAFTAPTASIALPAGTAPSGQYFAKASGPSLAWDGADYDGPIQADRNLVRLPLDDALGGTSIEFAVWYTATSQPGASFADATLTSGALTATERLYSYFDLAALDDPTNNRVAGGWEDPDRDREALQEGRIYYEWISPAYRSLDDDGNRIEGPALDEDYYLVDPPAPGERLVVSTNASDGQIALSLFSPSDPVAPLGVEGAGPVPGAPVTEQTGDIGAPAEAGGDAGAPLAGHTLVDQAVVGGGGSAEIEAASTEVPAGEQLLLRVTSGNGKASTSLYSLRARYVDEPREQVCGAWSPAQTADPGVVGASDPVTDATNTVYLMDTRRFGDTYGGAAAAEVRQSLASLTGTGHVGGGTVQGAVLSVDSDPAVQSARATLDANPCSMSARRALTAAVNAFAADRLGDERDHISSIVIVGGDDVLPLAPVAQHTAQFNEASHAASLRLPTAADGSPCPETVAEGALDACATPLSAAAATNHILTDDAYGLATAYESLGGHLYVPTVGVGRLVETPAQITATIARFVADDGLLDADSTVTGGYGAWAELPALVTERLAWRSSADTTLAEPWTRGDVEESLFPAAGESPRVVSVNTHADETRMLPGIPGAADGRFADADLLNAADHTDAPQLAGSLVFMIGCHAGANLPTSYYGDVPDWVDVFSSAGGFVGNTGFGLANNVTTALGERLLGEYADWIGTEVDGTRVSAAGALAYAKQSYLGGLGLYSGYDEKVLMEAVYYGLPMYAFSGALKSAPLPEIPAGLTPVGDIGDGLSAAGLSLTPTFQTRTATDAAGREVTYLTADDQAPLAVAGQPVLPRVVSQLAAAPAGTAPRGVLISGLVSERSDPLRPALAEPGIGVPEPSTSRIGSAFPSVFATVTSQQTPQGPIDLVVATPGRVEIPAEGRGVVERFTSMDLEIVYGPLTNPDGTPAETAPPVVRAVEPPGEGGSVFRVHADGTGSPVAKVQLLVQPKGGTQWQTFTLAPKTGPSGPFWEVDTGIRSEVRWIVQVADAAGNVATESARGHLDPAGAGAPSIADQDAAALTAGERLVRSFAVEGVAPGERLTASFAITSDAADGGAPVAAGPMVVQTGADGVTRALLDHVVATAGLFSVEATVCRGSACDRSSFALTVDAANTAPAASVTLSADTPAVWPSSTLTADGEGTDPDGDTVDVRYSWFVNGGGLPVDGPVLSLDGRAGPGDVVEVVATPNDGTVDGHSARTSVLVLAEPDPPTPPTITVTATTDSGDYVEGEWSNEPVTVTFTCHPGDEAIAECPAPVVVSDDTGPDGTVVSGTARDVLGGTASAGVLVRVDRTAPLLAPVVTPNPVALGGTATAASGASDAGGSGIASESCDAPATGTAGSKTVVCRASDVAGNTAEATAAYTVVAPSPACRSGSRVVMQPVNPDGSSVFARISAVPVVFRLCDEFGRIVSAKGSVTGVTQVSSTALPKKGPAVNELPLLLPTIKPVYVPLTGLWAGSIGSATLKAGQKYTYRVDLADGTSFTFSFGIK